jgi:zeaxanthin glucosyltransferase
MPNLLIIMAPRHLGSTAKLGANLRRGGHRVQFCAAIEGPPILCSEPFESACAPLRAPLGPRQPSRVLPKRPPAGPREAGRRLRTAMALTREDVVDLVRSMNADAALVDAALPAVGLAAYSCGIPTATISTILGTSRTAGVPPLTSHRIPRPTTLSRVASAAEWWRLETVQRLQRAVQSIAMGTTLRSELLALARACEYPEQAIETLSVFWPSLGLPEFILCPQQFDFPDCQGGARRYMEPSIDLDREEEPFPEELLNPRKRLIYCSLGRDAERNAAQARPILRAAVEAASGMPDHQFVIATGRLHLDNLRIPPDTLIFESAPQIRVLKRASAVITHGGFNSVKEAISLQVPMIVCPLTKDQPGNGARVAYHQLGAMLRANAVSAKSLIDALQTLDKNMELRANLRAMSQIFCDADRASPATAAVTELLSYRRAAPHGRVVGAH